MRPSLSKTSDNQTYCKAQAAASAGASNLCCKWQAFCISSSMELMPTHPLESIPSADCKGGLPRWQLRRILDYIESSLGDHFTVADLARFANVSRYHLGKMFKRSTGLTLHQFVTWQRVHRAQDLLLNSYYPLSEIASATGFASQSHFTTVFTKAVGITPASFRQKRGSAAGQLDARFERVCTMA